MRTKGTRFLTAGRRLGQSMAGMLALLSSFSAALGQGVPLDPYLARLPVVERILQAPVFENPLVYVGDQAPDPTESRDLWNAIDVLRANGPKLGVPALELYIQSYPNSVWTPSLRNNLAFYYRNIGRYSLALEHWEAAWEATRLGPSGNMKAVADFALAHWTRLLASLGRKEVLALVFQETQGRLLDAGPLQQMWIATREGYATMISQPGIAYRCGTMALRQVGGVRQPASLLTGLLAEVRSPESGFSLTALKEMADQLQLRLVAVQRIRGDEIVVPSLIHWALDHYAAITERNGGRFKVEDPTFERTIWMEAETINAEASGYFLVPADAIPAGYRPVGRAETDQVVGRGYPWTFDDAGPEDCPKDEGEDGGDDWTNPAAAVESQDPGANCGGGTCNGSGGPPEEDPGGPGGCSGCGEGDPGMAFWKVTGPHLNLWIVDRPMFYTKSTAKRQSFRLVYKQRNARSNPFSFGLGPSWECNRLSYLRQESTWNVPIHYVPGGGTRTYPDIQGIGYQYKGLAKLFAAMDYFGRITNAYVAFPNARIIKFGYVNEYYIGSRDLFVTQQIDRWGRELIYNYTTVGGIVRLDSVTDHDGRSTTFNYDNGSYPFQITSVADPHGRSIQLQYSSSGHLTNVVDAAGIASGFVYDAQGWITNLITPYGTTSFKLTGTASDLWGAPYNTVNRSCLVTEPNGSKQLSIYRNYSEYLSDNNPVPFLPADWPTNEVPVLPYANTLDSTVHMRFGNSFHWNRQQYSALNSTFRASENFQDLTVADYDRARMRHYLADAVTWNISGTLSMQREPSPGGGVRGQTYWYDYPGKSYPSYEGTSSLPSTIAWVLPNGQTHYRYFEYNGELNPTLMVTSYGDASTARTNQLFYYANGRDLQYELGPEGRLERGYSYNGYHQVLTATNALGEVTTYGYDASRRISTVQTPAGLLSTYTWGADGFVSAVVDSVVGGGPIRTNQYTYLNSFVRSRVDPRGLARTYYWDDLQRLTGVLYPDGTTISNLYTYLDLTWTKDRLDSWRSFTYNLLRQKIAETDANNRVTRYEYCECGALSSITRAFGTPLQETTMFYYDLQGNRTHVVHPDGTSLVYKYDALGRLTNALDALGGTSYWYNNQGLLTAVSNGVGRVSSTVYDINDRAASVTDANGVTVTQSFDDLGRLLTRTYPDGGVERFGYSAKGLIQYTDQLGKVTLYDYDPLNRKVAETNANNEIIRYSYNAAGDLKSLADGKNQVTAWNYDKYGRVASKVDQANVEILRYAYDANGRLTNRWSIAKGDTKYSYDAVGNLMLIDYPSGTTDIRLEYDDLNRVANMMDATGTTRYTYKPGGLLETEDGPWADDTVSYSYNNARLRSGLSLQQPSGAWTNGFSYDAAHRLAGVSFSGGTFAYAYKGSADLVTDLALPNMAKITNAYDALGRLTGTYLVNNLGSILNKDLYIYNAANQRVRHTRIDNSYYSYAYDDIGQLKAADSTVNVEDRGYLYDPAWNLNQRTNNGALTSFGVNVKNELTDGGSIGYSYDANGNLTAESGGRVFSYDAENQLTAVEQAQNWRTEFVADGRGRRRIRKEYSWSAGGAGGSPTPLVAGVSSFGMPRANWDGWVGFEFAVGGAPLTITELGRWVVNGNNGSHTVKLFYTDGTAVPGGSATVNTAGQAPDRFAYAALPAPVTLAADTTCVVMSQEFAGADQWYDYGNTYVTLSGAGSGASAMWAYNNPPPIYGASYGAGQSYGPVNLRYSTGGAGGGNWSLVSETRYLYDGMRVIQERDGSNTPTVSYTRGRDLSGSFEGAGGIGGLLARSHGYSGGTGDWGGHNYYHADGGGNITMLIDASQVTVAEYRYDPYGNTISSSGDLASANVYRFSSKELHPISGLYYYGYRFYDPNLQRWVNRDPLGETDRNLYRFVINNPLSYADPYGLDLISLPGGPIFQLPLVPQPPPLQLPPPPMPPGVNVPPPCAPYPDCLHREPEPNMWHEFFTDSSGYMGCYIRCMGLDLGLEALAEGGGSTAAARYYYTAKYPNWFKAGGRYSKVLVPRFASRINGPLALLTMCVHLPDCIEKCLHEGVSPVGSKGTTPGRNRSLLVVQNPPPGFQFTAVT